MLGVLLKLNLLTSLQITSPVTELAPYTHSYLDCEQVWETPEQALTEFSKKIEAPPSSQSLNFGFSPCSFWGLVKIENYTQNDRFIFELDFHNLDQVTLWTLDERGLSAYPVQGDHFPSDRQYLPSKSANYLIPLAQGKPSVLLYHVKTHSPLQVSASLLSEQEFVAQEHRENILLFSVYGVFLCASIFYLIIGLYSKVRDLLYYALYSVIQIAGFMSLTGHAYQLLGSVSYAYSDYFMLGAILGLGLLGELTLRFLNITKRRQKAFYFTFRSTQMLCAIAGLCVLGVAPRWGQFILHVNYILFAVAATSYSVLALLRKQQEAKLFLVSYLVLFLSLVLFSAKNMGYLPYHFLLQSLPGVAAALQSLLMSMAIGQRIAYYLEEQKQIFDEQRRQEARFQVQLLNMNRQLEDRIAEKTADLRLLLDRTKLGLFTIERNGVLQKEHSKQLELILESSHIEGKTFADLFLEPSLLSSEEQEKVQLAIDYSIGEELMFCESNIQCIPPTFAVKFKDQIKHLEFEWYPLANEASRVDRLLVSVRDVTDILAYRSQALNSEKRIKHIGELVDLGTEKFRKMQPIFNDSMKKIKADLQPSRSDQQAKRRIFIELHTMKSTARLPHLSDLAEGLHEAEEFVETLDLSHSKSFKSMERSIENIELLLNDYRDAFVAISQSRKAVSSQSTEKRRGELASFLQDFSDPIREAARLANKPEPHYIVEIADHVKLPSALRKALSKVLVHMISNCLTHGIEAPAIRLEKGKGEKGTLSFFIDASGRLGMKDDGQGIVWRVLRGKAEEMGQGHLKDIELLNLLFAHGFSTRKNADMSAGRGVGLDAVRESLREVGSELEIVPIHHHDSHLEFYFAIHLELKAEKSPLDVAS